MNTERGQLMLDMAMVVTATSMLTDPTQITRLRCTILTRCQSTTAIISSSTTSSISPTASSV